MSEDHRRRLAAAVRGSVPRASGVYALLDADGRLLYIGKSVDLRQRVASYFRQNPLTAEPHLGRLVASIRSFAWWQTRSELLALLLEDVLIKEHLPPMNTRQREFAENRYLEFTEGVFPACRIVGHADDLDSRDVFGPLKDKYFAEELAGILHVALGIRTCGEPEPVGLCLDHDIGRCAGPCRGKIAAHEYRDLVEEARCFLSGHVNPVVDRLARARDRAAAAKRYEEAARLRDAIDTCRRFEVHQEFVDRFAEGDCRFRSDVDGLEYRFADGALTAPRDIVVTSGQSEGGVSPTREGFDAHAAGRRAVAILRKPPSADRRFLADRARIVGSWVRRHGDGCRARPAGREAEIRKSEPPPVT